MAVEKYRLRHLCSLPRGGGAEAIFKGSTFGECIIVLAKAIRSPSMQTKRFMTSI